MNMTRLKNVIVVTLIILAVLILHLAFYGLLGWISFVFEAIAIMSWIYLDDKRFNFDDKKEIE
jgi:hypothetical protein